MKRRLTGWQYAWRVIALWGLGLLVSAAGLGTMLALDRLFPQRGARGVAGYVIITGLVSLALAWGSRRPGLLGRTAWLLPAGWAAHVVVVLGLFHFGVWNVRDLESEPYPHATLGFCVGGFYTLLLGGDYLLTQLRERTRSGRSAGRRGRGPSASPS